MPRSVAESIDAIAGEGSMKKEGVVVVNVNY